MANATNAEAYAEIRQLIDTSTGRVSGVRVRPLTRPVIPAGTLHPEPALRLHEALHADRDRPADPDWPFYVVSCDGTPVAWLTVGGRTVALPADLTAFQRRHQALAVQALMEVHGWALSEMADLRDWREGRTDGAFPDPPGGPLVRVAAAHDPTRTWWTAISGDPTADTAALSALVGSPTVRIIDVYGYGYGQQARQDGPISLDLLCALHTAGTACAVSPHVVGDWYTDLTADRRPDPGELPGRFAAVFHGTYSNRHAFLDHVLTGRGWPAALDAAGIPDRYLDRRAIAADLTIEYRIVDLDPGAGIAVLTRTPPG